MSLAESVDGACEDVFIPLIDLEGMSKFDSTCRISGIDDLGAVVLVACVPFCFSCGMTRSLSISAMFSVVIETGAADVVIVYCASKTSKGIMEKRMLYGIVRCVLKMFLELCGISMIGTPVAQLVWCVLMSECGRQDHFYIYGYASATFHVD